MAGCEHESCVVTREALMFVSERLCLHWQELLRHLRVEDHVINRIRADNPLRNEDAAYEGLLAWSCSQRLPATMCALRSALAAVSHKKVADDLASGNYLKPPVLEPGVQLYTSCSSSASSASCPILRNVDYFVGREEECRQIMEFCDFDGCKTKLLCVSGLPGIGKSELVNQALSRVLSGTPTSPFTLLWPQFAAGASDNRWSLEEVAVVLLEDLGKPFQAERRMAALFQALHSLASRHVIVLEVAPLNLSAAEYLNLWNFIARVLRRDADDKLKVIATCCKLPEVAVINDFSACRVLLRELNETDSVTLLLSVCSRLEQKQAQQVYRSCGGIPILLRKLAAHFNNNASPSAIKDAVRKLQSPTRSNYVQALMRKSLMFDKLNVVFNELDGDERETLVILSASPAASHISIIMDLFGPSVASTVEHLFTNHSIVEKSGKYFRLNAVVHDFVRFFVSKDPCLQQVMLKAEVKIVEYHLDMMLRIVETVMWNKEPNLTLEKRIQSVRRKCVKCGQQDSQLPGACACRRFKLLCLTFLQWRVEFLHALRHGSALRQCYGKAVDTALMAVPFLANILAHEDIASLFDVLDDNCHKFDDALRCACVQSTSVYASMMFLKCTVNSENNLDLLEKGFRILSRHRHNLSPNHSECLARVYLKRGHLLVTVRGDLKHGERSIMEGLAIREAAHERSDLLVAEAHGELADIYADQGMFDKSVESRLTQISLISTCATAPDRTHPFLAAAYRKQGATHLKMKNWGDAFRCYKLSLDVCQEFYDAHVETMRAYRCVGNALKARGSHAEAVENLKKAFELGRELLGDHEDVAQCCDELILALGEAGDCGTSEYEQIAAAMREAFNVNKPVYYSRPLRRLHSVGTQLEDKSDRYFCVVAVAMAVLFIYKILTAWYSPGSC